MAITPVTMNSVLVVIYQIGLDEQGAPKLRQRSFSNVRAAASDQDVYDVARHLYALQQYPLVAVRRNNCFELAE